MRFDLSGGLRANEQICTSSTIRLIYYYYFCNYYHKNFVKVNHVGENKDVESSAIMTSNEKIMARGRTSAILGEPSPLCLSARMFSRGLGNTN